MEHFLWKDNFNIGVEEIDGQHRLFLGYVNECYDAACRDNQSPVTADTIIGLKAYADRHFRFEENVMREKGYPDLENHIKEHRFFETQVAELENIYAGISKKSIESLLQFLRDWFLTHILEHDKKLAAFLK